MMSTPLAHIAGIPIEESLLPLAPALLLAFGTASAMLRAQLRRARSRTRPQQRSDSTDRR